MSGLSGRKSVVMTRKSNEFIKECCQSGIDTKQSNSGCNSTQQLLFYSTSFRNLRKKYYIPTFATPFTYHNEVSHRTLCRGAAVI